MLMHQQTSADSHFARCGDGLENDSIFAGLISNWMHGAVTPNTALASES
jgi:hypothetical protein